jgi:hypothetical protein
MKRSRSLPLLAVATWAFIAICGASAKLPASVDACKILSAAEVDAIIAPGIPGPKRAIKPGPVWFSGPGTSHWAGCGYMFLVPGGVSAKAFIEIMAGPAPLSILTERTRDGAPVVHDVKPVGSLGPGAVTYYENGNGSWGAAVEFRKGQWWGDVNCSSGGRKVPLSVILSLARLYYSRLPG